MYFVGIDIGSTAAKVAVCGDKDLKFVLPTGWSGKQTAAEIRKRLYDEGIDVSAENVYVGATGYGRNAVDYANCAVTEISCHAEGGSRLAKGDCTVIDVGGQDTKVIMVEKGRVSDFIMNDKCAAGTGKFVEIMANRLGVDIDELFELAERGKGLTISSLCTVFAETEVINYIGEGREREDIAFAVADSVASKVALMCRKQMISDNIIVTGGLSGIRYFADVLGRKIHRNIKTNENGKYAGALGAAYIAERKYKKSCER